ncbi:Rid family detoxifying hydrolase [Gracilimonas sp.]|uniref:Rid family detoxifying hydrolase n=1 Tax=Gracilimonas sp. TaxID=1974203 RepID=UPI002871AD37|nr:Rid family detoxifying hydrolase [Gracilimonas sp.]
MKNSIILLFISAVFIFSCSENESPIQKKTTINTENAPAAVGVYSQAVEVGNTLYLSGQIGLIPETGELAGDDLTAQTHQTLQNIEAILIASGYTLSDVVKSQVYLADMDDYSTFNDIYVQYFPNNPPARAVVEVSRIPLDAKVEIMITAAK